MAAGLAVFRKTMERESQCTAVQMTRVAHDCIRDALLQGREHVICFHISELSEDDAQDLAFLAPADHICFADGTLDSSCKVLRRPALGTTLGKVLKINLHEHETLRGALRAPALSANRSSKPGFTEHWDISSRRPTAIGGLGGIRLTRRLKYKTHSLNGFPSPGTQPVCP